MSVIAVAVPPSAGSVHSVPRRSMAMVRRSGESAAAMFVPSCSVRCTARGAVCCPRPITANPRIAIVNASSFRMLLSLRGYNSAITRLSPVVLAISLTACHATSRAASPARPTRPAFDQLTAYVDTILADPALGHGFWGVLVKSLKTDETLYSVNARRLMLPASNMKIVTLAAAADRLGWDFTYETTLLAAGSIDGGLLHGDLIVVGSGDPSIGEANDSARPFSEWADPLKELGIRAVSGGVIGDDRAFADEELGFGWSWDDIPDDYSAGISPLQYDENAVRVTVTPGPAAGEWAGVSVAPPDSGLTIDSAVKTSTPGGAITIDAHPFPRSSNPTPPVSLPAPRP